MNRRIETRYYVLIVALASIASLLFIELVYDIVTGGETGRTLAKGIEPPVPQAEALPYEPLGHGRILIIDDPTASLAHGNLEQLLENQTPFPDEWWHFATTVQKGKSLDLATETKRRGIKPEIAELFSVYRVSYNRETSSLYFFEVKVDAPARLAPWFQMPIEEGNTLYFVIGHGISNVPKAVPVEASTYKPASRPFTSAGQR